MQVHWEAKLGNINSYRAQEKINIPTNVDNVPP